MIGFPLLRLVASIVRVLSRRKLVVTVGVVWGIMFFMMSRYDRFDRLSDLRLIFWWCSLSENLDILQGLYIIIDDGSLRCDLSNSGRPIKKSFQKYENWEN